MVNQSLREKEGILENRIADETFKELKNIPQKLRPKKISLYGADPQYLVKIMIALQDRFKKIKYNADIFIGSFREGEYSVDVGYYQEKFKNSESS